MFRFENNPQLVIRCTTICMCDDVMEMSVLELGSCNCVVYTRCWTFSKTQGPFLTTYVNAHMFLLSKVPHTNKFFACTSFLLIDQFLYGIIYCSCFPLLLASCELHSRTMKLIRTIVCFKTTWMNDDELKKSFFFKLLIALLHQKQIRKRSRQEQKCGCHLFPRSLEHTGTVSNLKDSPDTKSVSN